MASGDRENEMTMPCEPVRELLPWYLNRTLGASEAAAVTAHLAGCASCRAELEGTARVAWIAETHLPVEVLTEYAFGSDLQGPQRSLLERHLAHCEQCRAELRTALEVADLGLEQAPPSGGPTWWPLAVAASLTIFLLGGLWWSSRSVVAPSPTGNVALVELLPESLRVRGGADGSGIPADRPATVVLVTDLALEAEAYRARLLSPADEVLWQIDDLLPAGDGTFVLHLPGGPAPPVGSEIRLEAARNGEWEVIETYSIRD